MYPARLSRALGHYDLVVHDVVIPDLPGQIALEALEALGL